MIMIKSLYLSAILLLCSACAFSDVKLPDEYVRCQHVESGEVFKYVEDNAIVHRPVVCPRNVKDPVGACPTIYVIEDLEGVVRYYSGLEMVNWRCEDIRLREGGM